MNDVSESPGRRPKIALITFAIIVAAVFGLALYVWRAADDTELIFERAERSQETAAPVTVNRNLLERIEGYDSLPSGVKKNIVGSVQNACVSTQDLKAQATTPPGQRFARLLISCADGKRIYEYFAQQGDQWRKIYSRDTEVTCAKAAELTLPAGLAPACPSASGRPPLNPGS